MANHPPFRILVLDETFPPDIRGYVPYSQDLCLHLRRLGHVVDVLTVGERFHAEIIRQDGGSLYRMGKQLDCSSARLSVSVPAFMLKHWQSYDLVHLNSPNPIGELGLLICKAVFGARRPRLIVTFHAEVVDTKPFARQYNQLIARAVLQFCDKIVVSSPSLQQQSRILAPFKNKMHVIPFGTDIRSDQNTADSPKPSELWPGKPRLLFVGRLARYKGLPVLIEAMRTAPGHLNIVGDGPLRMQIEEAVRKYSLSDRVRLFGRVNKETLRALFEHADIHILPSIDRGEAFGYVLIEAMAYATALITTELHTGTSWVNVDGETGIVVPPNDSTALSRAIAELSLSDGRLESSKRAALARYEACFRLDRMLSSTVSLYEEVSGRAISPNKHGIKAER